MESKRNNIVFNAYQYLFYRIYVWQLGMFGEENNPKFTALVGSSIFVAFNLLSILTLIQAASGYSFRIEKVYAIAGTIVLYIINYFLLLYGKKSQQIIAKFSNESETERKTRTLYCCAYVLLTFVIFIFSVIILEPSATIRH